MALQNRNRTRRLTEGPITRALVMLALPIVGANILQTAYQLIDTFWVGRLGAEAVAAVSLSFPVIFLMIAVGGGLGIAGTILVAQYAGREDQGQVNHVAGQTLLLMLIAAAVAATIGYFLSPALLGLMGAEADVLPQAVSYLRITFLGMPFLFGYFVFQSLMRGVGDATTPLWIVLFTVLLNLVLDPLFIFGWGPVPALGVAGAAAATIATQGLAAIIGLSMLFSGRYSIGLSLKSFIPDFPLIRRMAKLGLPASVEQSTMALGLLVMTFLVASFGTATVAAYGIGGRILSFVIIPAIGFSQAATTIVGQNVGAGKVDRAEKASYMAAKISFAMLTVAGVFFFIFSRELAATFVPGEEKAIAQSTDFIRIMALAFGFVGARQTFSGAFRGAGRTLPAMLLAILSLWVLRFPLAYILSKHTDLAEVGIWWAFPVSDIITAVVAYVWFSRGGWKSASSADDDKIAGRATGEVVVKEEVR